MNMWIQYYAWLATGDGPNPPQEILEDDDLLDEWVERWKENLKKKNSNPNQHSAQAFSD
jgi:hypothetical protein